MLNPFADVDWNPDEKGCRIFAKSLMIGFPAFALGVGLVGFVQKGGWPNFSLWLGGVGCAVGLFFYLLPKVAKPFYVVWYFVACCVGFVVGNTLFSTVFYGVITPIGWVKRLVAPKSFLKKPDPARSSYWRNAEKGIKPSRYFRQF
jgi:hypothetical protein